MSGPHDFDDIDVEPVDAPPMVIDQIVAGLPILPEGYEAIALLRRCYPEVDVVRACKATIDRDTKVSPSGRIMAEPPPPPSWRSPYADLVVPEGADDADEAAIAIAEAEHDQLAARAKKWLALPKVARLPTIVPAIERATQPVKEGRADEAAIGMVVSAMIAGRPYQARVMESYVAAVVWLSDDHEDVASRRDGLRGFTGPVLFLAVARILATSKFLPTISELLEAARQARRDFIAVYEYLVPWLADYRAADNLLDWE